MPPRRRRRRNERALPAVAAVIIGLAVAAGIYWYQHPDMELGLPRGFIDRVAQESSQERTPESFAAVTAASTPDAMPPRPTGQVTGSDRGNQLRQLVPQVGGESREEREARTLMEAATRVSDLELKVNAGINAERARNGGSRLKWEEQLAAVARAHSDDMTVVATSATTRRRAWGRRTASTEWATAVGRVAITALPRTSPSR